MNNDGFIDIPGYEGLYAVNKFGEIKSYGRFYKSKANSIAYKQPRIMKAMLDRDGYERITLTNILGVKKKYGVHQIVASAFYGEKEPGYEVMHLDGDRKNNNASNLRYGSSKCNKAFMVDDDTVLRGEKNNKAKLSEEHVRLIRKKIDEGFSAKELSAMFGVSRQNIGLIRNGKIWSHIL